MIGIKVYKCNIKFLFINDFCKNPNHSVLVYERCNGMDMLILQKDKTEYFPLQRNYLFKLSHLANELK